MTSDELKGMLELIDEGLRANMQILTNELIDMLRSFVNELRMHPGTQEAASKVIKGRAGDFDLDKLLAGLSNALDVEQKLIGQQGEVIIKVCKGLASRPMFLSILARFM